ncbi:hypothetical protein PESP_a0491 [Pseudoalteromonas espejiana DSM 9414]|uniref:Glycosyl transferase n=1 Tax=Pseudoalteromonas espejiana TaxID=28107 RepID=A0A510XXW9_9GAMM|nr:glycosyltransferase family 4 protein [Pseudoalteromonas espejiana]ASM48734.1 hypothetical protein PESP_a0491 [Pseudoalteromonas espejiana DSM 9414]GEK55895.1 glycosyl transferase [Pseudoalteromonas espejiana]
MKHYLFVANSPFTITNFRKELVFSLISEGGKVSILCPNDCNLLDSSSQKQDFINNGVDFYNLNVDRAGMNPLVDLMMFLKIIRTIKKVNPSIILNYTIKPTIYSSLAGGILGKKFIYSNITGMGYAFTDKCLKAKLLSVVIKLQYKLSLYFNNKVFFQNPDDLRFFAKNQLIRSDKAVLINGSGVDIDYFKNTIHTKIKVIRFLFVGRLLRDKGVFEYIEAAKIIKRSYPDAEFLIAGAFDSNPSAISEAEMQKHIGSGLISYLGNVRDIKCVYQNADVFILPSYREGTPRSTLEAMSMEMPIITTDAPGCRETVKEGYNGYLVPTKNVEELATAMERFIVNRSLIKIMGYNSRKIVVEKYDVKKVNKAIIETLIL